jgi:intracellular sulfur oxidation DsrE/DsrF family protein
VSGRRAALGLLAGAAVAAPVLAQRGQPRRRGLVLQVSDAEVKRWVLAISNARNVQDALGRALVDIDLVAYGPGIDMLKWDSTVNADIDDLIARGVRVIACENTMIGQKLSRDDMHPKLVFVKTGLLAIMERQEQGWSYVRP